MLTSKLPLLLYLRVLTERMFSLTSTLKALRGLRRPRNCSLLMAGLNPVTRPEAVGNSTSDIPRVDSELTQMLESTTPRWLRSDIREGLLL